MTDTNAIASTASNVIEQITNSLTPEQRKLVTITPASSISSMLWVAFALFAFAALMLLLLPLIEKQLMKVSSRFIDVSLVASLSGFIAAEGYFGGKEAFEYMNPFALFFIKGIFVVAAATLTAIKAYRMNPAPVILTAAQISPSVTVAAEPPKPP